LWCTRYLAIYLSIGWMSEGTNQALMHAKCRERGEINSHPHSPAFSRIFHAAAAAAAMSSHTGWKNKFHAVPGSFTVRHRAREAVPCEARLLIRFSFSIA